MAEASVRQIKWSEVKNRLDALNPELCEAMARIPAEDHPALYMGSYLFGEEMIGESGLHPSLEELAYSTPPLMLMLNKTAEMFVDCEDRVFPIHLFEPGELLGGWEILDQGNLTYHHNMWRLVAGARTVFLVPKVTEYVCHSKMLRLLNIEEESYAHNLFDQGKIFRDIARSPVLKSDWRAEVLFFGKSWFDEQNEKLSPFRYTLLKQGWGNTLHVRNHMTFEMMWQLIAQAQAHMRLKPNIYVIETVKHLMNIATGASLGFAPVREKDERILPLTSLQTAYLDYYGLKHYIPTFLAPAYLRGGGTVYYSFLVPTLLSLSPNFSFRNTLEDERNIKNLLERFTQELIENHHGCFDYLMNRMSLDFFHFEADPLYQIHASSELAEMNPLFSYYPQDKTRGFCENGPFIRSCVQIARAS